MRTRSASSARPAARSPPQPSQESNGQTAPRWYFAGPKFGSVAASVRSPYAVRTSGSHSRAAATRGRLGLQRVGPQQPAELGAGPGHDHVAGLQRHHLRPEALAQVRPQRVRAPRPLGIAGQPAERPQRRDRDGLRVGVRERRRRVGPVGAHVAAPVGVARSVDRVAPALLHEPAGERAGRSGAAGRRPRRACARASRRRRAPVPRAPSRRSPRARRGTTPSRPRCRSSGTRPSSGQPAATNDSRRRVAELVADLARLLRASPGPRACPGARPARAASPARSPAARAAAAAP